MERTTLLGSVSIVTYTAYSIREKVEMSAKTLLPTIDAPFMPKETSFRKRISLRSDIHALSLSKRSS